MKKKTAKTVAKKTATKTTAPVHPVGEILVIDKKAIKDPVLGKVYTYKKMNVEVCFIGSDSLKVRVVK